MPLDPKQEEEASWVVKHRDRTTWRAAGLSGLIVVLLLLVGLWMVWSQIRVREEVSRQADRDRTELIEEMRRQARAQHERTLEANRKHDQQIQRQLNVIQKTIRDIVKRAGGDVSDIPRVVDGRAPPSPPPSGDGPDGVKPSPSPSPLPTPSVKPTRITCTPAGKSHNCLPERGPP